MQIDKESPQATYLKEEVKWKQIDADYEITVSAFTIAPKRNTIVCTAIGTSAIERQITKTTNKACAVQRLAYEMKLQEQFAHLIASLGDAVSPKICIKLANNTQFWNDANTILSSYDKVVSSEPNLQTWNYVVVYGN